MCCGGIYKRAEGLADEIGADLYAPDAHSAVEVANANPSKKATVDQQTVVARVASANRPARTAAAGPGIAHTPASPEGRDNAAANFCSSPMASASDDEIIADEELVDDPQDDDSDDEDC